MKHFLLLFFISLTSASNAQQKQSEISLITIAIENYFYGYIERDESKLLEAFDVENGTMKRPVKVGSVITGYTNAYFKEVIPKWGNRDKLTKSELESCHLTICTIAIESNQMATVKMRMQVGSKTYIDVLSLQKIKNNWKITNKMYIEL